MGVAASAPANGPRSVALKARHALRVYELPMIHRDPFDRLLIAQSQLETLPILTADPEIARYNVDIIW